MQAIKQLSLLRIFLLAFTFMALFLLSSCGKNVHYTDSKAVIIDEVEEYEENGMIVLHIVLENDDSDSVTHSVYRVEWFDEDEKLLNITPWRPITVKGGHRVRLVERATMPAAKEYNIVISNEHE